MAKYGDAAILPYQAEVPIKETLEFLTDIVQAYNASEQRLRMRFYARQSFNYIIPLNPSNFAEAFNTQYGAMRSNAWLIPIWSESQYVGNIADGSSEIECVTDIYGFIELAMLINDCGDFRILTIDEIESDRLVLSVNVDGAINNAYLMPVRRGWIQGDIEMPTNGYSAKQSVTYVLDDFMYLVPDAPEQYLDNDIYYEVPYLSNGVVQANLSQHQEVIDMELGVVSKFTHWNRPQYGKPWRFIMTSPDDVYGFRVFFYRRAGKHRAFWFPTFDSNMRVTSTGAVTTILAVKIDAYTDFATLRTHIAIEANGVWYPRAISGITELDSERMQFTLSSTLGGIPASSITRVSFLGLHRLDTDRAELIHNTGIVETNVQVLELAP